MSSSGFPERPEHRRNSGDHDPHQQALYRAEEQASPDGGRIFRRFEEVQRFVEEVTTGAWWESCFPDAPIEVTVLRRSRGATFSAAHVTDDAQAAAIWVRDGSWNAVTVVHELAHVALAGRCGSDGAHGSEFATALLICWRELLGMQAYGALRSALDVNGIPLHHERLV